MKILTAIILFSFSTLSLARSCEEALVKIIFEKKPVMTKEVVCSKKTSDAMLFYVSKSCLDDGCEILKREKSTIEIKDYYNNIGSPGFKICNELGGIPQIFEFSIGTGAWQSTERCLFGKHDFVEISFLTRQWKSFIKK